MTVFQARVRGLLRRYADGDCSPEEFAELMALLRLDPDDADLEETLDEILAASAYNPAEAEVDWQRMQQAILDAPEREREQGRGRVIWLWRSWRRLAAVAAVLLLLAGGWWLWRTNSGLPARVPVSVAAVNDRPPGGNRAILTLAGGQRVVLDSAANGLLAQQGSTQVQKTANSRLVYEAGAPTEAGIRESYNTLSTPRGGQYQLTLPDGTQVWLNAASSITYPTAFAGKERSVTVAGEAYFEVAANDRQPFLVKSGGMTIVVLGTSFNINSYPDEPDIRTTLITGKVRVGDGPVDKVLEPGQQLRIDSGANGIRSRLIPAADIEQALAWKNGQIKLTGAGIREIMRQVSRWYDVDIQYEGNLDRAVFSGVVSRRQNVSKLLAVLEATGSVDFTINNKIIIVKPH